MSAGCVFFNESGTDVCNLRNKLGVLRNYANYGSFLPFYI